MNLANRLSNTARGKHAIARAIACGMLLVLPACNIPKLRPPVPAPALPTTFNGVTNPENSGQLKVEDFYNDPLLISLFYQALATNRELRSLDEDVRIASNEILSRSGAYLPFVSVGAAGGLDAHSRYTPLGAAERDLEYRPFKHFPDPVPDVRLNANVYWELDIWRALRNARDAAALRSLGAAERRNYFVTRLIADIADHYYALLALDRRMEILDQTIALQEQARKVAEANKQFGRGTELAVQRFQADVRRNQSEKLIVQQDIIEVENRINFLAGRYPQHVERTKVEDYINLNIHALSVGVPAQLLQNRPDIRQAERELEAAGLDVRVARAHFFPRVDITGAVGYEAFNPKYLFVTPDAMIYNIAGDMIAPLINKRAIQAEYMTANARQLQALYNYQRVILDAFTEVVNRMSKVENYRKSIEIKKLQLEALQTSVELARKLFLAVRIEYIDVLISLRDLREASLILIDTKRQQLTAIVDTYQALGGGGNLLPVFNPPPPAPHRHWWSKLLGHSAPDHPDGPPGPVPGPGDVPPVPGAPQPMPELPQPVPVLPAPKPVLTRPGLAVTGSAGAIGSDAGGAAPPAGGDGAKP